MQLVHVSLTFPNLNMLFAKITFKKPHTKGKPICAMHCCIATDRPMQENEKMIISNLFI